VAVDLDIRAGDSYNLDETLDPLRLELGHLTAHATPFASACGRVVGGSGWVIAALFSILCSSCSAAQSPGAADGESRSLAEYDLARDLWLNRGQTREALDHVLKAIELDHDNAEAAHLAALIYLDFCRQSTDACRLGEAERHAREALRLQPEFREARNTLGVALIHQKRYAEAIDV
jgi:type IV pilus assembly protein PilF